MMLNVENCQDKEPIFTTDEAVPETAGAETAELKMPEPETLEPEQTAEPTRPKKKKRKILIALLLVVAILTVAIVTPLAYVFTRPTIKLVRALDKTLFKSETLEFRAKIGEDDDTYLNINFDIDYGKNVDDTEFSLKTTYFNKYTDRISMKNGVVKFDDERIDVEDLLEELEDELSDNGIELDVADILDRVINKKLDRNELIKACMDEIFPAFQDYDTHGFEVNTKDFDFAEFAKGFAEYLNKEGADDIWTCKKAKDIKNKDGNAYKYCFELSEFMVLLYEYALIDDEFDELLDEYTEAYWDNPYGEYYIYAGYGSYTSPADMKSKLIKSFDQAINILEDEEITMEGRFVISRGRLTYFEWECDGMFAEIDIESKR